MESDQNTRFEIHKPDDTTKHNGERTPLINGGVNRARSQNTTARSFWSKLTFQWFTPILQRGNLKKRLDQNDLGLVPFPGDCATDTITTIFEQNWKEELQSNNPSLIRALIRSFGADFLRGSALKLIHDLCIFVGPHVLHSMIVFLRSPDAPLWHGLALTLAVTISQMMMSICVRHYFFKCYCAGLRARTAIVIHVYRKALVLSSAERQIRSSGEIINLMSIDAQRLQDLMTYLNSLWSSPLQIALALYFLWRHLGPSSFGGVGIIIIMIPVTQAVAKWMGSMQRKLMQAKDGRIELNGEVLKGMKIIKLQAWEESFRERILALRQVELATLFRYLMGSSFSDTLWVFTPLMVALATFTAYVCSGHQLDVASALTALALFDILRFPLFMLPSTINSVVEAIVSIDRLKSFFLCDEHEPIGTADLDNVGIKLENVSAVYESKRLQMDRNGTDLEGAAKAAVDKDWEMILLQAQLADAEQCIRQLQGSRDPNLWSKTSEATQVQRSSLLCLSRISLHCEPGELVAIVGSVGSGKSSLINALLGELRLLNGTTAVKGKIAYFSQMPFIMQASIRDNILFSHVEEPVNEVLYQRALSCSALRHDLSLLPAGDLTEVGERGITLSGGQKARIALARAVYHNADITLIDDALAAVDAHVANHIFDEAIVGELMRSSVHDRQRSVILATNAVQYLNHPRISRIVVLQDGRVVEEGNYATLAGRSDSVFSRFLTVVGDTSLSENLKQGYSDAAHTTVPDIGVTKNTADHTTTTASETVAPQLIAEELRQTGQVDFGVYWSWISACGGVPVALAITILYILGEGVTILSNWWLTYWSQHSGPQDQIHFLSVYAIINVAAGTMELLRTLTVNFFGLKASKILFFELLSVVLHAPMAFFDTTPIGRLVNRFSKDIYTLDEQISTTVVTYLSTLSTVLSTLVVISGVTPIFLACLIPMVIFYVSEQKFFSLTYRELKRLDAVNRSPIYALLGESIDGVAVIRSFCAQDALTKRLIRTLDIQQHAYFLICTAQSWLAIRLELIGTLIITFAALSAVIKHAVSGADDNFAGLAGLSISYALAVTQSLNWSVRMASELEANMVAVERIREYTCLEDEGMRETRVDTELSERWPCNGKIEFSGAKLRYRVGLPLILKGLDLKIPARSKVGVVGRTGAGKSTLLVALTRLVDLCDGNLLIDEVDIRKIGLKKLRRSIAVIPQDPVLFSGTIRSNLDPFQEFNEQQLNDALEVVGLFKKDWDIQGSMHSAGSLGRIETLDDVVCEEGVNYSVGQRQLIVIARALLRGAKVVIIDEATAAIDAETDAAVQRVLRTQFADATCLTIAHRINTIMDSDFILVMDDGRAAEFDKPEILLQRGGLYRELVMAAVHPQT